MVMFPTIDSITVPKSGVAQKDSSGTILYTPAKNYYGTDSFQYTITDGEYSSSATVSIQICPYNDLPVADPDTVTIDEDSPATVITPMDNDYDPEGDPFDIYDISTPPSFGIATFDSTTITYTPNSNFLWG